MKQNPAHLFLTQNPKGEECPQSIRLLGCASPCSNVRLLQSNYIPEKQSAGLSTDLVWKMDRADIGL